MSVIRSYNLPTIEGRPAPNAGVPMNAPVGAFGNAAQTEGNARAMQVAGAYVERAAETTGNMALSMMEEANEARVQELANGFMSGSQFTLYTDKDAFYRKRGQNAIDGAQAATDKLLELKKEAIGNAANATQRRRLEKILGAQIVEANGGISRHVSTQAVEWQKGVAEGKQALIRNQAALDWNDVDKIDGLALAAEDTAKAQAKLAGLEGTEAETAMTAKARSDVYSTVIAQRLQNDQKRSALALYDRVKDRLDEKDSIRLASAIKSTRTEVEGEDWLLQKGAPGLPQAVRQYIPQVQRAAAEHGVDPVLATAVLAQESGGDKGAVSKAGARGLMQLMPGTAGDLGVKDPHDADQNIAGGVRYLGQQLTKYNGDQRLALMAYNWGPGNVDRWVKAGSDPSKVPQETRDYLQKVQGYAAAQGVGFDKANTGGLVLAAMNDPSLTPAVKASIATRLNRESATLEATRTAQIKGLRDLGEATLQTMVAAPGSYKKNTLGDIADGLDAAGEKSEAVTYRLLASMEDQLLSFAQAPKSAQEELMRTVAASLAPGKGGALMSALNTANKKDAADAAKAAGEDFAALRTAATNGVRMDTMEKKARGVVDGFMKGGDFAKAREVQDWFNAQVAAQAAGQAPAAQLSQAAADMKTRIESGEQTNAAILQLDALERVKREQAAGFAKDALAYGAGVYSRDLGPLPAASDLAARVAYAEQVSQRQGGLEVLAFTQPEIAQMKTSLDSGPPEQQAKLLQALSALPKDAIPGVAAALAGKDSANRTTRGYAAALSFFAENNPNSRAVGNEILDGIRILKADADSTRKPESKSDAWSTTLKDTMSNLFRDTPELRAAVEDGAALVYLSRMHRAGKQGDRLDIDVLRGAIKAVVGEPVELRGQAFLPPVRGMTSYDVDKALRSLSDGDLDGLRTQEGTPITASVIQNRATLTNGRNGEGWYFVRIPDPRAGGDPRPVMNADGSLYQLDLRPLMERAARLPEGLAPLPDAALRARQRAPANPTEGVAP
jgi:soluble lytic murein transglycosylase-like protein